MFCVRNIYLNIALLCLTNNMETRSYPQKKTFTLLISLFYIFLRATTLNKTVELPNVPSLQPSETSALPTSRGETLTSQDMKKTTQIPRRRSKMLVKDVDFPRKGRMNQRFLDQWVIFHPKKYHHLWIHGNVYLMESTNGEWLTMVHHG